IIEERTLTKSYGWVFFYNSKLFLETRDIRHGIAGNGPLVVLASTGELVMLGTARPAVDEIVAFEHSRNL
ncbi:MAG TPA: YrhB domain-containing protein, partial [Kofleriaceae bacterium]